MTTKEEYEERARIRKVEMDENRESLEYKYDVRGNPKAKRLYEIAYEMGHSGGFSEIENYYMDLVELIRNVWKCEDRCKKCDQLWDDIQAMRVHGCSHERTL